jgi:hypothetical protein
MNPFSELPSNFFVPLAFGNREHYAALLLIYYNLFLEYHNGVERELVVAAFEKYFTALGNASPLLDSEEEQETPEQTDLALTAGNEAMQPRNLAASFLRRFIRYGWMLEEVLYDYTQMINMPVWAKPFYLALHEVAKGVQVEYESHIIGIYSSLCSDSAGENGHLAVLNARNHTRLLIDSLKILAQNIKNHVQKIFAAQTEVKELLHIHYDIYMHEIVDKAYNRLKTSDNLSKYRPLINQAINRFLQDELWLAKTTAKLAVIKNLSEAETIKELIAMLKEIRDALRSIDPILEEIDDKNRQYSRISMEKIKARLYADSSLQGKAQSVIHGLLANEAEELYKEVPYHIPDIGYLVRESLFTRRKTKETDIILAKPPAADFAIEKMETELILRIRNQLNPAKVAAFLRSVCHQDGSPTQATEMLTDMASFVRLLYAAAYAESRSSDFPYRVQWGTGWVEKGRFRFREHYFVPRLPQAPGTGALTHR